MRVLVVSAFALTLTGCGGFQYALDNYTGVPVQNISVPTGHTTTVYGADGIREERSAHNYRIFDKPDENRLMITAAISDAAAQGWVRGASLGALNAESPQLIYRNAAQHYLDQQGRGCQATSIDLIVTPQYEVRYTCPGPATTTQGTQTAPQGQ